MSSEASVVKRICLFVVKLECICVCVCVLEKHCFYYLFKVIYMFMLRTVSTMEGFFSFDIPKASA